MDDTPFGRARKLNEDQVRDLLRRRRAGESVQSLADRFGVGPSAISYRLAQHMETHQFHARRQVAARNFDLDDALQRVDALEMRPGRGMSREDLKEVVRLYHDGGTMREIGDAFKVHDATICLRLKQLGLTEGQRTRERAIADSLADGRDAGFGLG